jgi:hypothetical protein
VLVLATQLLKPAYSAAVQKERQVYFGPTHQTSPVAITKVTVGDTVVQAGRMFQDGGFDPLIPFQAGDDWIQNLSIYLYNRTNKTIVCTYVLLGFAGTVEDAPPGAADQPAGIWSLHLGRIPASAAHAPQSQPSDWQPISFLPGQTMVIRLGDYIGQIRSQVGRVLPLTAVTGLTIALEYFYFADGMFSSGSYYIIRDPQSPGKDLRMDRNYFPGDMNFGWPGRPDWGVLAQQDALQAKNEGEKPANTSQLLESVSDAGDCVSFNPANTAVQQIQGSWKVVDGDHWIFDFGGSQEAADRTLAVIKHYQMNKSCSFGHPPNFSYMLVGNQAPAGALQGEDCHNFNPANIQLQQVQGRWKIVTGDTGIWMNDFGNNKDEADKAFAIIKKYGFTEECFTVKGFNTHWEYLRK